MRLRNIILLIFVLFALSSFYRPIQISSIRYKHTIVRQINFDEDKLTGEIIKYNKSFFFRERIAVKMQLMIADRSYEAFNTS
jgi:hypothetical protein